MGTEAESHPAPLLEQAPAQQASKPTERPKGIPFDPQRVSAWEVLKNLTWDEFRVERFGRIPCAKQALLTGIAVGLTVCGLRWGVARKPLASATNWGVMSGVGCSLASWEYCRYQLRVVRAQLDQMAMEQSRGSPAAMAAAMPSGLQRPPGP